MNDDFNDFESDGSGDDCVSELSNGRHENGGLSGQFETSCSFSEDFCAHAGDYDDFSLGSDNALTFSEEEHSGTGFLSQNKA